MSIKNRIWKLMAAAGLALGVAATGASAVEKGAHEHGAAPAKLMLNDGSKWATDAPLRKGMESIRSAIDASLHEIHAGKLSEAGYNDLAKRVNTEVGGVVANCKLEPKADAQLHLVIADMLQGAEAMEGKAKKVKRQAGAVTVLAALDKYATYFDHPNWEPIKHHGHGH